MLGVLTGFIEELRQAGVPVSMVEVIDSMRAVEAIEIDNRTALRETLRATLVKNLRHERAFDTAFDVYFSLVPTVASEPTQLPEGGDGPSGGRGDSWRGTSRRDRIRGTDLSPSRDFHGPR